MDITTFDFSRTAEEIVQVRSTIIDGEPWFIATDVLRSLNLAITQVTNHVRKLAPDEVRRVDRRTLNLAKGAPMVIVSESGLYKLIMRSDKAEALAFQHWIASEVLPSIRKTGSYDLTDHGREAMPLPMDVAEAMARVMQQNSDILAKLTEILTAKKVEPAGEPYGDLRWTGCPLR